LIQSFKKIIRSIIVSPLLAYDYFLRKRSDYDTIRIRIRGSFPEMTVHSPWRMFQKEKPDFFALCRRFEYAAQDQKIKNVILILGPNRLGFARTFEILRSIDRLRENGKTITAIFEGGGAREYLPASRCDKIVMLPPAHLFLTGVSLDSVFLSELLTRLGIEPDLLNEGKYKSAAEMFTRKGPSKFAREMMNQLVSEWHDRIAEEIAAGRKITVEQAKSLIDEGPFAPEAAKEAGLVDEISYFDEFMRKTRKRKGRPRTIDAHEHDRIFGRPIRLRHYRRDTPKIALLTAAGPITDKPQHGSVHISADLYADILRQLRRNSSVKAVVLRVSSPGGSGLASDLIHHELERLKKKKPVVVSMGDAAASGGYYLSMAGDTVFTERTTLTGSIGVISGKFSLRGLYKKIGVSKEPYRRGENAGIFSDYDRFTETEREKMMQLNRYFYREFTMKVGSSRGLSPKQVEVAAEGRVMSGDEAVNLGLADRIGGLMDAIREAVKRTGLSTESFPNVVVAEPLKVPLFPWTGRLALLDNLEVIGDLIEDIRLLSVLSPRPACLMPFLPARDQVDWW
jgi:protease IV